MSVAGCGSWRPNDLTTLSRSYIVPLKVQHLKKGLRVKKKEGKKKERKGKKKVKSLRLDSHDFSQS
jgi:hypothetical protein